MSKTSIKNRIFCLLVAFIVIIGIIPNLTVSATPSYSEGGYARVSSYCNVLGPDREVLGQVEPGEGVTVLYCEDDMYFYVECNTPNGPLRGSVHKNALQRDTTTVCANVKTSGTTYYSPDGNNRAGSVDAGELVAVLAHKNGWAYIEYNVSNAQRKRAYIRESFLTLYYQSSQRPVQTFYQDGIVIADITVNSRTTIYSGPNALTYDAAGYVTSRDNGKIKAYKKFYDRDDDLIYYISYPVDGTNTYKYGYIYA